MSLKMHKRYLQSLKNIEGWVTVAEWAERFGLEFKVDHARALLNPLDAGAHYSDNLQLLLKAHNAKKNSHNWQRFNLAEQMDYIDAALKLQSLVAPRLGIDVDSSILTSLFERLKAIY